MKTVKYKKFNIENVHRNSNSLFTNILLEILPKKWIIDQTFTILVAVNNISKWLYSGAI